MILPRRGMLRYQKRSQLSSSAITDVKLVRVNLQYQVGIVDISNCLISQLSSDRR